MNRNMKQNNTTKYNKNNVEMETTPNQNEQKQYKNITNEANVIKR